MAVAPERRMFSEFQPLGAPESELSDEPVAEGPVGESGAVKAGRERARADMAARGRPLGKFVNFRPLGH